MKISKQISHEYDTKMIKTNVAGQTANGKCSKTRWERINPCKNGNTVSEHLHREYTNPSQYEIRNEQNKHIE